MTDIPQIAEGLSEAQRRAVHKLPVFVGVNWPTMITKSAYGVSCSVLRALDTKGLVGTRGNLVIGLNKTGLAVRNYLTKAEPGGTDPAGD
ncbi:hypothetical protein [Parasphingopyxis sp.]|uniref:hypothetical protein n=1 Tax=Parasphingopyxis sp. TaxID=1920299 RepID=UPI002629A0C6|nr:hypothetical protein [Parasphingopyxis sp.]